MLKGTLVACPDFDGFHGGRVVVFVIYRSTSGTEIVRYPSANFLRSLFEGRDMVRVIWQLCGLCKHKGVRGITLFNPLEDIPLDPFEKGEPN